jgi:hypothetical protein
VVVDVSHRPVPVIWAGGDSVLSYKVCNNTALLVIDSKNGTLSQWSNPVGSVTFSPGSGQDEYHVSIPDNSGDYGQYRIYAMSEAGDCAGLDSIDLTFFEQPATAVAGEGIIRFLIDEVQLNADPATAGIGTWYKANEDVTIVDENDPNTFVRGLKFGENTFQWTVTNGEEEGTCSPSNGTTVVTRFDVKTYNGFSPNGDMSNEYFIMRGLVYADEFSISFLNSLGTTVRTINQDNIDELEFDPSLIMEGLEEDEMVVWDGRADNGNLVASGTYYFVLTITMYLTDEMTTRYTDDYTDYVVVVRE